MIDNLVDYLNHVQLGDAVMFAYTIICSGLLFKEKFDKSLSKHNKTVVEEYKEKAEADHLIEDVNKANEELSIMRKDLDTRFEQLQILIDEHIRKNTESSEQVEHAIAEFNQSMLEYIRRIESLEIRIDKMECQIDLLFKSDKEYFKAFIMEGYNKYVKLERSIDLVSLQNIENIYNKYLEEGGEKDEFLAKLMKELRNLPTTKEKKTDGE